MDITLKGGESHPVTNKLKMLEINCHIIEKENKSERGRNSRMDYLERTETPLHAP